MCLLVGLRVEQEEIWVLLAVAAQLKELSLIEKIVEDSPRTVIKRLLALQRSQPSPFVVGELFY